jgi:large-conductance mechanosensitive channel
MIRAYSKSLKEFVLKGDPIAIGAALLVALAAYFFLQTLVEGLIGPAIAAIFSKPGLYALSFTVNEAEFGYGSVLSGLILLALALIVVAVLGKVRREAESRSTDA